MKRYMPNETIDPNLMGLIVISHGEMSVGMLDSLSVVCNIDENVMALVLQPGDEPEAFQKELDAAIELYHSGCLVFVDMMGGTPFNSLMMVSRNRKMYGAIGFNLAMLIEAAMSRNDSTAEEIEASIIQMMGDTYRSVSQMCSKLKV